MLFGTLSAWWKFCTEFYIHIFWSIIAIVVISWLLWPGFVGYIANQQSKNDREEVHWDFDPNAEDSGFDISEDREDDFCLSAEGGFIGYGSDG